MAANIERMAPPTPRNDWLEFDGTVEQSGNLYVLRPAEESSIEIIYRHGDVLIVRTGPRVRVHVRYGAKFLEIRIPKGSVYWSWPIGPADRVACAGGNSRCLAGLEYCCDDPTQAVGNCTGKWRCPNDVP